jgi:simple sugar transport system permease protein
MANIRIEKTPRQELSRWFAVALQGLTVLAALAVASIALVSVDANPLAVYSKMFVSPLTDQVVAEQVLNRSAPLILAGLAVYIPLKSGLYNIGAEGQFIVAGLITLWAGVTLPSMLGVPRSSPLVLLLALLLALLIGVAWIAVPIYLYIRYEVNEILTTLMLVFTAERLSAYLISGPLQAQGGGFPRTDNAAFDLPTLFGRVHVGILFALLAVAGTWLLLNKTKLGYEIILSGSNKNVAQQAGISTAKITVVVFTMAAALAGLAGYIEVTGQQSTLTIGWQPGYGWTGIVIALLGREGAVQTMLAGFLFGVIFVGGNLASTTLGVPSAIIQMIEALCILFLISAEFVKSYQLDVVRGNWSLRDSMAGLVGFGRAEGS